MILDPRPTLQDDRPIDGDTWRRIVYSKKDRERFPIRFEAK